MRQPTLTYKAVFLIGGAALAALAYLAGTWIYHLELDWFGRAVMARDFWTVLSQLPTEHPITLYSWLVGSTALSVVLGYLFDRQVKLTGRLEALAVTDGLTLVFNHRYFMQQFAVEIKRTQRITHRLALLLLDIDDFKRYNDTQGHLAGDRALRAVADAIRSTVRETDLVARYGGEEFVVIASGANALQAATLAERIRRSIGRQTPVTVSIGIAGFPDDGDTVDELVKAADAAMYRAKSGGKDRIQINRLPTEDATARPQQASVESG